MTFSTIVFVDRSTIPVQITLPKLQCDHQWVEYESTSSDELYDRVKDADVIITNKVHLDRGILERLPKLKLIAVSATGVNNVDLACCRERDIAVTNVQGYAAQSVPEHVVGMIYALRRNLFGYHRDIENGEWQRNKQFCFFTHSIGDVAGSTLGIIGSGVLGQATATLARAIGMKVIFAERKGKTEYREGFVPFEELLCQADVISLHCPLSKETENLIAEPELEKMKRSAILINTGRGGLVDESALVKALKQGRIAAAGVDVFTQEPADKTNPLLANIDMPNLLLTPHVAWGSDSAIQKLADILIDNIEVYLNDGEQNRVV
ncbi:D-2-hydroxyacid dehydrogenase [Vibrio sp. RC27]